jgi:uncharacterized protein YbjT (DUF2867 family)
MHILVTGGTGVVGKPTIDALLRKGHSVRLLTRHASRDARLWHSGVEPLTGSVADDAQVRGAAAGCDAILHIAGIVDENPPAATFENVNVRGTQRIVDEAQRAGVRRLVHVSSIGAERGSSAYHRSKRAAEQIVERSPGNWLICRSGNVYGPGDQVISLLLKMMRTLPAIPVITGKQRFQPVRAEDLAAALANAVEDDRFANTILELAGAEQVTIDEVLDHLESITDRHPRRIPVPEQIALAATSLADAIGVNVPVNAGQIRMLLEENVVNETLGNALTDAFGVQPTPLRKGLELLADSLPEKLPSEGVGPMWRQRYWADIRDCQLDADALFEIICRDFFELLPAELVRVAAEPGTGGSLVEGATMTMAVPLRGNIQVRVEEVGDRSVSCVTVAGHHLAGVIHFSVKELSGCIRFEVRSYARASHLIDRIGMAALGSHAQEDSWRSMVAAVVQRSGGSTDEVHEERNQLDEREAGRVERWVEEIVMRRERDADRARPGEDA